MTHKIPRITTQNWEKVIESGMTDYEHLEKPAHRHADSDSISEGYPGKRAPKRRRETSHRSRSL